MTNSITSYDRGFRWITGAWSPCSKSCGGGISSRMVVCRNEFGEEHEKFCPLNVVPVNRIDCNTHQCPHWEYGGWSECDAKTCVKMRQVCQGIMYVNRICDVFILRLTVATRLAASSQTINVTIRLGLQKSPLVSHRSVIPTFTITTTRTNGRWVNGNRARRCVAKVKSIAIWCARTCNCKAWWWTTTADIYRGPRLTSRVKNICVVITHG